mgnify:CR=1 FL=1
MQYYEKNLSSLRKRSEEFACLIDKSVINIPFHLQETPDKQITASIIREDGKAVYLHSRHNPVKEADRTLEAFEKKPDIFIIGGFGLGYHVEAAVRKYPDIKILVLEKDISFIKYTMTVRDISAILENENVEYIVTEKGEEILEILQKCETRNIAVSILRLAKELYPDTYSNITRLVHSFVNSREINIATLARFQKLWTRNILNNAFHFTKYAGINTLYDKFAGVPIFIVASGPSLSKNIEELRRVKGKGLILAMNSAFRKLVDMGIIPDMVMAVDPQDIITKFFTGVYSPQTLLITEITVSKKIITPYPGSILFTSSVFKMGKWLEEYSSQKGEIDVGGSVATAAYGLAVRLGCSPVIFCGLDLAYPGGETHFQGSYFEDNWLNEADKINTAITLHKKFMRKHELMEVPSYYNENELLKTDRKFLMFLWWFESKFQSAKFPVIDATEGGAYKKGAIQMKLGDAVKKYCTREVDKSLLRGKLEIDYLVQSDKLAGDMKEITHELEKLKENADKGIRLSEKLYEMLSDNVLRQIPKPPEMDEILAELEDIDKIIQENEKMSAILSLAVQKTINNVTHNFDNCLSDAEKEHQELRIARQSIQLYEAVQESAEFNLVNFKKAIKRIRNELSKENQTIKSSG